MGNLLPRNNCINRKITISTELRILLTNMKRALNRIFNQFGGKENREEIKIKKERREQEEEWRKREKEEVGILILNERHLKANDTTDGKTKYLKANIYSVL